jgi:hypothetical protein
MPRAAARDNASLMVALPVLAALLAAAVAARRRARRRWPARARIVRDGESTTLDARGAVRSRQAADLTLPAAELARLWSPEQLERLAATYWRFLTRATLGLVRVDYSATQRTVVLLRQPLRLLRFTAPEYALAGDRGVVRWRIEDGLLVARRGHHGDGYLQIAVRRAAPDPNAPGHARIHVEVEVANFYPAIAHRISVHAYRWTQSIVHELVTHGFLRSLARLDLAESRVGRFAAWRRPSRGAPPAASDYP